MVGGEDAASATRDLADEELEFGSGDEGAILVTPSSSLAVEPQRGSKGGGRGCGRGEKAAPKESANNICISCQAKPCCGNNHYCKEDKREHDAVKKDAVKQGK